MSKRANLCIAILLILFGLTCVSVLPGFPGIGASTIPNDARLGVTSSGLTSLQQVELEKLYASFKSGAPFSEEEAIILSKFGAGEALSDLEAKVAISRTLFDYYISGKELTREQQQLLARYLAVVQHRSNGVADLKTQLLKNRIASEAAAPLRTSPLAPPANDLCSGAEVIPTGGPFPHLSAVTADITDATTVGDPPAPSCQNNISRSIWYVFNPSATADYTITTCSFDGTATTVDDTVMAIYTSAGGCAGPFTEIPTGGNSDGCGDDECVAEGFQAVITTRLNAGVQYYIVLSQFGSAAPTAGNTAVQLLVSQVLTPGNDSCSGASVLALDTPVNGTTVGAGNEYQLSSSACFTGLGQTASTTPGREVVYSFTAPSAATYSFRVTNFDVLSDLVLYVATTCPLGSPPLTVSTCLAASNRTSFSSSEEVSCVALSSGQQVFVFVDDDLVASGGSSFTIEVNLCTRETEPNDTPATAESLQCGVEGSISPAGEADFYSLGTPAAGSRLFALADGAAGNSTDFDLRVTTTTDTLEYDDFANDALFGSFSANVAGTPLTGAPAFIRVSCFSPADASEPYRLYAVVQPPSASATVETEPNDTRATANSASNNYFTGSLVGPAPSTDADFFAFTATPGDLIFLSLDCDPTRNGTPISGALELLASDGTVLVSVNDGGVLSSTSSGAGSLTATTPSSPAEGLIFRATTSGTFYARVFIGTDSTTSVGAGDYLLSISRNCLDGAASCTFTLGSSSQSFASSGGTDNFLINTQSACIPAAASNDAWIHINSSPSMGSGAISYSVDPNTSPNSRSGTLTVVDKTFTVLQGALFVDVPQNNVFFTVIGKLSARGVTTGCGFDGQGGRLYCPADSVSREQMAAFIMRALGEFNPPQPAQQRFADVPPTNLFYAFIERLAVLGVTTGCGVNGQGDPIYCPSAFVTREQMAAFLVRAKGEFNPPQPAQQRFADVPPSNIFYAFIDRLAALGITLGCGTDGQGQPIYCPSAFVAREQMAAFLVRAFGL